MKQYLFSMLVLILSLAGCSATGPSFLDLEPTLPNIEEGNGRLFFIREASWMASGLDARIAIDGEVIGKCPNGAFFWEDLSSGRHVITVDHWGNFGEWELLIDVIPNEPHFLLISPRRQMVTASIFGPITQITEAVVAEERRSGTFQVKLLDAPSGKASLAEVVFNRN